MANLFKKIIISHQQIRFLPRLSQSWPDTQVISKDLQEIKEYNNTEASPDSVPYPKIKWKRSKDQPSSLVINAKEKQGNREAPQSITKKLKESSENVTERTIDSQGNLLYTKMGNKDIRVSKIMASVKTQQKGKELIVLEGKRLIKEALETGCKLEYILFSRMKEVEYLKSYLPKVGKLYKMPYREMQIWSDLTTNPGIMGIFKIPPSDFFKPKDPLPLTVICDNVREPTNLGAIIRTSSAVGCEQLLLTKGCVNVWETKVLRSACGAHFRTKLSKELSWEDIRSKLGESANVFIADNNIITSTDSTDTVENLTASVPVVPYFSINFSHSKHIVLIIGGETEGVSADSYKLAKELNGVRLNIPLSNGVDSLNTGTALAVIAFEIKKQLKQVM